ncbi:hypothetical protein DEU56DRAFT_755674 [Suillus clintonianus]|uniref:uncharacterized protein n=1 Tax=Suillus clintonianus TaxID=1904413 RepID=UPI001B869FA7|nr:uncharacterized protein DEU56DRAFT_755674 [Suillus clintonianus]KAG2138957.1 hypothetical protein DEU56DRAFT_755674 [Suillus clintonianus]
MHVSVLARTKPAPMHYAFAIQKSSILSLFTPFIYVYAKEVETKMNRMYGIPQQYCQSAADRAKRDVSRPSSCQQRRPWSSYDDSSSGGVPASSATRTPPRRACAPTPPEVQTLGLVDWNRQSGEGLKIGVDDLEEQPDNPGVLCMLRKITWHTTRFAISYASGLDPLDAAFPHVYGPFHFTFGRLQPFELTTVCNLVHFPAARVQSPQ